MNQFDIDEARRIIEKCKPVTYQRPFELLSLACEELSEARERIEELTNKYVSTVEKDDVDMDIVLDRVDNYATFDVEHAR